MIYGKMVVVWVLFGIFDKIDVEFWWGWFCFIIE